MTHAPSWYRIVHLFYSKKATVWAKLTMICWPKFHSWPNTPILLCALRPDVFIFTDDWRALPRNERRIMFQTVLLICSRYKEHRPVIRSSHGSSDVSQILENLQQAVADTSSIDVGGIPFIPLCCWSLRNFKMTGSNHLCSPTSAQWNCRVLHLEHIYKSLFGWRYWRLQSTQYQSRKGQCY
jgi:hypothetical protein